LADVDADDDESLGVRRGSPGVECFFSGVSVELADPESCDGAFVALAASGESLLVGTEVLLDAERSSTSLPFPPIALDVFALSSFICTSALIFVPGTLVLVFFSLTSLDTTPRFASDFAAATAAVLLETLGLPLLDELAAADGDRL
jgi:hypothetical protein